mmetsp:Transcript_36604/g.79752  ORF Transcript_36604/g.79752 Transcript_36604/m.79752 type:complete len:85 (-) Transcript_36604:288-542(-)|eukprot:CAMPEP_0116932994 /NCGR_PEP_ID=MMETSP0467-20121206/28769_1 /TAXON_ID=283647 /ORGANISM="Mesodinium pulex, Strain SPMC105" /LENGTH=84 /DNA_ID=CAMNT_0004613783 /DNA_START=235 /DNA_END=489 /DNA_ORIENTATION=+
MFDKFGHMLHIDFGFMFEIFPGGKMFKFERSAFKFSYDYKLLIDADGSKDVYNKFLELTTQGFLICRKYSETIMNLVTISMYSD